MKLTPVQEAHEVLKQSLHRLCNAKVLLEQCGWQDTSLQQLKRIIIETAALLEEIAAVARCHGEE